MVMRMSVKKLCSDITLLDIYQIYEFRYKFGWCRMKVLGLRTIKTNLKYSILKKGLVI